MTGAPRSPQRTWAEKDGRSPYDRFYYTDQKIACEIGKAFETYRYRPRYAEANLGHPSYFYRDLLAKHPTSLPAGNTLITFNEGYSFHVEGLWKKVNQVNRLHGVLKL
jgi:hypothetical protein